MITNEMEAYIASVKTNDVKSVSTNDAVVVSYNDLTVNSEYAELKKQIQKDTRRGHGFWLKPGEKLSFYPLEKSVIEVHGFELVNGSVRAICSVHVWSSEGRGRVFPLSVLRKMFAHEVFKETVTEIKNKKEVDKEVEVDPDKWFYEDNDLAYLASNTFDDLGRIAALAGKTIVVSDSKKLQFHEIAGNPPKRTGKFITQLVNKFKIVE